MKTDRELLELAARAAGYTLRWIQGANDDECIHPIRRRDDGMCEVDWLPLTDDGDALRLAVRLNINVHKGFAYTPTGLLFDFRNHANMMAATRRAIVRAAAAIGEGMK